MIRKPRVYIASRHRAPALLGMLAAALLTLSPPAATTGMPVIDIAAITNMIRQYAEQIREFEAQVQQWNGEIQHWTDMKSLIGNLTSQLQLITTDMQHVDKDYMVKEQCGGNASIDDIVQGLLGSALDALNPGGDISKQQQEICVQTVMVRNKMFNETVDYVQDVARDAEDLNKLVGKLGAETTPGALNGIQANANALQVKTTARSELWSTRQSAYQAQLQYLQFRQQALARAALGGTPNVLGQIVDTVALKAAFSN